MKTIAIIIVLLLTISLSSCSSVLPEEIRAEEQNDALPVSAEARAENQTDKEPIPEIISTEVRTGKEPVSEDIGAEEPTDVEAATIVFMGATINAPGFYSGVPNLYVPVLDDLYLYCEMELRNNALNREGAATLKNTREMEIVKGEIRQRGHLPYPGGGFGTAIGYALVDLDADGNTELLILNNSAYGRQTPAIMSIYATRNGQLVCIDNGSFELEQSTVLAVDGTFYQFVDWRGVGYADLSAFRMEPGRSEFSILLEARASLSFSDGEVPVPYWIKMENNEEIVISENEFDMLLEQYKNPNEIMILDFVPLHPDAVNPQPIQPPADEPPSIQIEYPESYKSAPIEYKPIMDIFYCASELLQREEETDFSVWDGIRSEIGFVEFFHNTLGYAIKDINNDRVPELLLGSLYHTTDGHEEFMLKSIFTLKSGEPVHLHSFWSRHRGVISADGIIYTVGSGGAAYTYLSSFRLDSNSNILTQMTEIRSDYSHEEDRSYYVQVVDGKNHYISGQEFTGFMKIYDNPPTKMNLEFISIA